MIDGELGEFLRSRREAVLPEDVGLPAGPRRQTPGLRRAELATLAGVSVEYLIRLEQGRDTRPSMQVLAALAHVLRLSGTDRDHLQQLATVSLGTDLCVHARPADAHTVRPAAQAVLDALSSTPAVIVNHLTDLLAWNSPYDALTRPTGILEGTTPNLLRYVLTDPRAHDVFPDWSTVADEQVSYLHAFRRGDPAATDLANALTVDAGDAFISRWERRPLTGERTGLLALTHPGYVNLIHYRDDGLFHYHRRWCVRVGVGCG